MGTVKTASLRELNQRSGQIIAEVVSSGVDVIVTDRGRPVARIVREEPVESEWERLVRTGDVVEATATWEPPAPQRPASGRSAEEILDELRAER